MDSNINYQEKYIKYKKKYLELKEQLEGGKIKISAPKAKAKAKTSTPKKGKKKEEKEEREERGSNFIENNKKIMIKEALKRILNKMNVPDIFYEKFDQSKDINDFINMINKDKDLNKLPNIIQIRNLIEANKTKIKILTGA
jgi:hypothetical protein